MRLSLLSSGVRLTGIDPLHQIAFEQLQRMASLAQMMLDYALREMGEDLVSYCWISRSCNVSFEIYDCVAALVYLTCKNSRLKSIAGWYLNTLSFILNKTGFETYEHVLRGLMT